MYDLITFAGSPVPFKHMQLRFRTRTRPRFSPPDISSGSNAFTSESLKKVFKILWIPILIFTAILILYWPTRMSGFVSDDYFNHVFFKGGFEEYADWFVKIRAHDISFPFFRPVVWGTYRMDYLLFGANPVPMHVVNILLHALNAILVYILGLKLGLKRIGAAIAGLTYALYPAHPEAVVWLSGRYDILSCTFILLTALSWCKVRLINDIRWMIPAVIFYVLAIYSKEVAFAGILMLPLLDWVLNNRTREKWGGTGGVGFNWKWYIVFFGVFITSVGFRLWLYGSLGGYTDEHNQSAYLNIDFYKIYENFIAGDLNMLFTPVSRILWVDFPASVHALFIITGILLGGGIIYSIVNSSIESGRTSSIRLFSAIASIIWILIFLTPVITVNGVKSSLDFARFLYIPAIGLAFLIGTLADTAKQAPKHLSTVLSVILAATILMSGYALSQHNRTWIEAGMISSQLADVLEDSTSSLPDNSNIYLINFPWLWKGAHCAPIDYGGWLEFEYGIKGIDTIELGTANNPYAGPEGSSIEQWWTTSEWNRHVIGFVWDPETRTVDILPLKPPRVYDETAVNEFLGAQIPPPSEISSPQLDETNPVPIEVPVFPE